MLPWYCVSTVNPAVQIEHIVGYVLKQVKMVNDFIVFKRLRAADVSVNNIRSILEESRL